MFILSTILFFLTSFSATAKDIAVAWEGTIDNEMTQKYNWSHPSVVVGEVKQTWKLNVRYREGARVDVKDKHGRLTGQFVRLEDEESTWTMTGGGNVTRTADCQVDEKTYSYEGQGNKSLGFGWVYYSLSDDDPLAEVVPNGAYYIQSDHGQWGHGVIDIVHRSCDGKPHPSQISSNSILSFRIGGINMGLKDHYAEGEFISAEGLRQALSTAIFPGGDNQIRTVNSDGTMTGSYNVLGPTGNDTIHSATWDLKKVLDVACTLDDIDKNWRPEGGVYSSTALLQASARLDESQELEGKFRFTLTEVSQEKGFCLNSGDEEGFDLSFSENQEGFFASEETADGWEIEGTETDVSTQVWIEPLDYGAWGKLKAEVNVDGVWHTCQSKNGKDFVTVPYDQDEDHMADWWEDIYGIKDEDAKGDGDSEPAGREDGDGFSNYEEYRGFKVGSVWQTTDPNKKDLFIHAEGGLSAYVETFQTASGLEVHAGLREEEYNGNDRREVNFNRGYGTLGVQKGLYLLVGAISDDGTAGEVSRVGSPNVVDTVTISYDVMSYYSDESLKETVAHELGHGVNLRHHGDNYLVGVCGVDDLGDSMVAVWGGTSSGDERCLMRYDGDVYSFYKGWDDQCYDYPDGDSREVYFCDSQDGTGVNAGPKRIESGVVLPIAGAAGEFGDCQHKMTLKGSHYDGY